MRQSLDRVLQACALFLVAALAIMPAAAPLPVSAGAEPHYDKDTGYRISRYRAATPDDVPGGIRIGIDDVERVVREENAILVDVMPSTGAGFDPKTGTWRLIKTHDHIPGSTWLPDVGRGHISKVLDNYFRSNLERLTGGDKTRPLLIYCQSDCWMGWNAVQRAASYGYERIYWYPDGIDGWRDWEKSFEPAKPVPVDVKPATKPSTAK